MEPSQPNPHSSIDPEYADGFEQWLSIKESLKIIEKITVPRDQSNKGKQISISLLEMIPNLAKLFLAYPSILQEY